MLKHAATPEASSADTAILSGIVEGFSEVSDISKIERFTSEVRRLFEKIKIDSEGFSDEVLKQMAYHMARSRANYLLSNKKEKKEAPKESPKESPKEEPEKPFVQPIVKRPAREKFAPTEETPIVPIVPVEVSAPPVEAPPEKESIRLTIRRAISDGFDFVEGLGAATTNEHIYDEAQRLYSHYIGRFNESTDNRDVYEEVFRATKQVGENIVAAHKVLVDKDERRDTRARKKEEAIKAEQERQRISEVAKIELSEFVAKMLREKELSNVTKEALKYFKLVYLDNKRDSEVVHLFPGTSRDQRYKWKERAVTMIAPYVSEDARKYISEKTKRKLASSDVLIKAAEIFLMRCQEG